MHLDHLLTTLIAAILGSLVTAQVALRNLRKDKWWERKAEAYDNVILALDELAYISGEMINDAKQNRATSLEMEEERTEAIRAARREVTRAWRLGCYMLSHDVKARLRQYLSDEISRSHDQSWASFIADKHEAAVQCLKALIDLARKDLRI